MGCAELLDYGADVLELVPGHGGEEMMLNLVIEPTVVELRQATAFDASGGYHLLSQEVQPRPVFNDGHSFVIWGKDGGHVDPQTT